MVPLVNEKLAEMRQICVRCRVKRLELFGSATDARSFDPTTSDVDLLVEFLPLKPANHAEAYFDAKEAFQHLLGRPVDLVMIRAVRNPYFLKAIQRRREVLYAA